MYREIEDLLELSKNGDNGAKEVLLNRLYPLIINSIRRYYNRLDQYDDLIQDGYLTILMAIDAYDPDKGVHFLGYIKTMLRYCYLEKHRERYHISLNEPLGDGEFIDILEGDEYEPHYMIIRDEESRMLQNGMNLLTDRQRQVVNDYYIRGLSIGEIANSLGIAYRTVVNTKTRAVEKIRNAMVK